MYLVSLDIQRLLSVWATRHGFTIPCPDSFTMLREELQQKLSGLFPVNELLQEDFLESGVRSLVKVAGLQTLSLDKVYYPESPRLEFGRCMTKKWKYAGLQSRTSVGIKQQIEALQGLAGQPVCLVDDVIFTGEQLVRLIKTLGARGIQVTQVVASVGIAEGIEKIVSHTSCGVSCVRTYPFVIDEICERDFYPGVPGSGRMVRGNRFLTLPYTLPLGNPAKWASIPLEQAADFSLFCLTQTKGLFLMIEELSRRSVTLGDLEDSPWYGQDKTERVVDLLKRNIQQL